ncbi:HAD family hydrolase [Streptomyces sp. NPDC002215]|uniref:HAD family hydrolase n=1 Tax=Streptomyces sp. NPDC002215 TaxID=3154412 RepID=UPI00332C8101
MTPVTGVLFDMNGLFRIWENTGATQSEKLAHLPPGTIARYAYDHPAYRAARVGILTDTAWADDVTQRLARDYHQPLNDMRKALIPWRQDRGTPVPAMIKLLIEVRRHVPAGVLSNCTDALNRDLEHHGITFDYDCSSARLGVDKPSPHAFRLAAERMGMPATSLAYFDDEPTFVRGAEAAGLQAQLFTGAADAASHLRRLGIPVPGE